MKKVIVASKNPVKIEATKIGFQRMFPDVDFDISGVSANSDVSDQPMGEEETLKGAMNRLKNVSKLKPAADYWVGIEGGLAEVDGEMESFAWVVIKNKSKHFGKSRTGTFFQPEKVAKIVRQGKELGDADDIVYGMKNSKQANGSIGILTGDVLTRVTFYEPAIIMALIPFKNPDLY